MATKKIVDYQRKVIKFAKQWGIDPVKVRPVPNDDGFTFMSSKSENIYYMNPDKGILLNTENLGVIYIDKISPWYSSESSQQAKKET